MHAERLIQHSYENKVCHLADRLFCIPIRRQSNCRVPVRTIRELLYEEKL